MLIKLDGEQRGSWYASGLNSGVTTPETPNNLSRGFVSVKLVIENATEDTDEWGAQASTVALANGNAFYNQQTRGKTATGKTASLTSSTADSSAYDASPASTSFPTSTGAAGGAASSGVKRNLMVRCLDAHGLPLGSDSYCRIFWNGRQVGKTLPASSLDHTPPTRSTTTAPAWVFQRNPVWWRPSTFVLRGDERQSYLPSYQEGLTVGGVVVPLHERLGGDDELTVEVFDAFHKKNVLDGKDRAGKQRDGIVGEDKNNTGNREGELKRTRDVIGRSLGSISIRGEHLVRPPKGRMDMALNTSPPSSDHKKATVRRLSLFMECLSHEVDDEEDASTEPFPSRGSNRRTTELPISQKYNARANQGSGGQPKRWLRLLLGGARLLHGLGLSGMRDPFCVVFFNRVWCEESRVCWGTLAPRWDHWVEIELCQGEAFALGCAEVRVEVWDKGNVIGNDNFLGEATLVLRQDQDG